MTTLENLYNGYIVLRDWESLKDSQRYKKSLELVCRLQKELPIH